MSEPSSTCWCERLWNWVRIQLLPYVDAMRANGIIRKNAQQFLSTSVEVETPDEIDDAAIESLNDDLKMQLQRWNRIEDKGRAALFVIGVIVSILTGSLALANDPNISIRWYELVLVTIAIGYFVCSAISVISSTSIRPWYQLESPLREVDGRLQLTHSGPAEKLRDIFQIINQNNLTVTQTANDVDAGFQGIRNGIILLVVFFLLVMWRIVLFGADKVSPQ